MQNKKYLRIFSEKINPSNKRIIVRTQEEIDEFNRTISYRKARIKRYGKCASQRIKERENKTQ